MVLLSGILWGCIGVLIKKLNAGGLGAMQISMVRMVFAALLFTGTLALVAPGKLRVRVRDLWMFVGTGIVSVVLFNVCYFYTMIKSQASIAVVLLYTSPVFVMLLSALIFHERITRAKLLALALSLCGTALCAGLIGGGYRVTPLVLLTGLGSGLFYALYSIFGSVALRHYDSLTVSAYTFLFGALGTSLIGQPVETFTILAQDTMLILWGAGIGLVCTILPFFFYTAGLKQMEAGKAAILVAVEPVVGAAIGIVFFRESCDTGKILGMALILVAILLLNLPARASKRKLTCGNGGEMV